MQRLAGAVGFAAAMTMLSPSTWAAPPGWPSAGEQTPEPEPELQPGEVKSGHAGFTLGKDVAKLPVASGTITKMEGIFVVDLTFKDVKETPTNVAQSGGKILRIGFATDGAGPAQMMSMFVAKSDTVLSVYRAKPPVAVAGVKAAAAGKCTITVTKIDEKNVEGTAECPSGMVDLDERPSPPIKKVSFQATAL